MISDAPGVAPCRLKPIVGLTLLLLGGCGSVRAVGTMVSPIDTQGIAVQLAQPIQPETLTLLRRIPVMQFYDILVQSSSDEAFSVGGHEVSGLRSRLEASSGLFSAMAGRYASWGDEVAANIDTTIAPGLYYTETELASLGQDYSVHGGAFAPKPVPVTKPKAQSKANVRLIPEPTSVRNLAALYALAIAGRQSSSAELGLVTNGLSGAACQQGGEAAVQLLEFGMASDSLTHACTGTFYGTDGTYDYMATAGHCAPANGSQWRTTNQQGQTVYGKPVVSPEYPGLNNGNEHEQVVASDQAKIAFPAGTAAAYMPLATQAPQVGQSATVIGYGAPSVTAEGQQPSLHCGSNQVAEQSAQYGTAGLVGVAEATSPDEPAGQGSVPGHGDSGGPLIVNEGGQQVIGGIAATNGSISCSGYPAHSCPTGTLGVALYGNVNSQQSQQFFRTPIGDDQSSTSKAPTNNDYPYCTNGSNTGGGYGWQPGIGGPNNGSCRVPPSSGNSKS